MCVRVILMKVYFTIAETSANDLLHAIWFFFHKNFIFWYTLPFLSKDGWKLKNNRRKFHEIRLEHTFFSIFIELLEPSNEPFCNKPIMDIWKLQKKLLF